jgi:parvulin-like peptidyl-prolyl isomerase
MGVKPEVGIGPAPATGLENLLMLRTVHACRLGALLLAVVVVVTLNHVQAATDIVAEVNGQPISRQTFQAYYRLEVQASARKGNPINEAYLRELRRRLIDDLVVSELLLQEARRRGVAVTDEELAAAAKADRTAAATDAAIEAQPKAKGIGIDEYREMRRRKLTIEKLIATHIVPDVTLSEADIQAFYRRHAERFQVPERLHIRHITLRFPTDADAAAKAGVRERIGEIQRQIAAGRDFGELAHKYSEDPSRQKGGDAGFVDADRVTRTFGQRVLELPAGQMSAPIESPWGHHLVIVEARQPARQIPLEQVQAEIRQALFRQKTTEPIKTYVKNLREKARIVIHE